MTAINHITIIIIMNRVHFCVIYQGVFPFEFVHFTSDFCHVMVTLQCQITSMSSHPHYPNQIVMLQEYHCVLPHPVHGAVLFTHLETTKDYVV